MAFRQRANDVVGDLARTLLILLSLSLTTGAARPPVSIPALITPSLQVTVGSIRPLIGDFIHYRLELLLAPGDRASWQEKFQPGQLDILNYAENFTENYWIMTATLAAYDLGSFVLPAQTLIIHRVDGGQQSIISRPVEIQVVSLTRGKPPESLQLRDIRGLRDIPAPYRFWLLWFLLPLVGWFYFWGRRWRRWKKFRSTHLPLKSPPSAQVGPIGELRQWLEQAARFGRDEPTPLSETERQLWQRLTWRIRDICFTHFHWQLPPQATTAEIMTKLRAEETPLLVNSSLLLEILCFCDTIRFGKFGPTRADLEKFRVWVDEFLMGVD